MVVPHIAHDGSDTIVLTTILPHSFKIQSAPVGGGGAGSFTAGAADPHLTCWGGPGPKYGLSVG